MYIDNVILPQNIVENIIPSMTNMAATVSDVSTSGKCTIWPFWALLDHIFESVQNGVLLETIVRTGAGHGSQPRIPSILRVLSAHPFRPLTLASS